MDRSSARAAAMKLIYEWEMGGEGGEETRKGLMDIQVDEAETDYMETLVSGVEENVPDLDGVIRAHAIGWTPERISRVDLCILRVGVYEMKYLGLSPAVAINEAVELARVYSTPEAGSFINGVLGAFAREARK